MALGQHWVGVKTPEPGWWVRSVPRGTGPRGPTRAGLVAPRGPGSGPHLWARQQVLGVLLRHTTPGSLGISTPPGSVGEQGLLGPTLSGLGITGHSALLCADPGGSMPAACVRKHRQCAHQGAHWAFLRGLHRIYWVNGGSGEGKPWVLGLVGDRGCFLGLSGVWEYSSIHIQAVDPLLTPSPCSRRLGCLFINYCQRIPSPLSGSDS